MPATRGQLVGQRLVDHHVAGVGTLVRGHDPQQAVPFPRVQRQEAGFGPNVFFEHEGDSGVPEQRQVGLDFLKQIVCYVVGQVVVEQRHAGGEQRMVARHKAEGGN